MLSQLQQSYADENAMLRAANARLLSENLTLCAENQRMSEENAMLRAAAEAAVPHFAASLKRARYASAEAREPPVALALVDGTPSTSSSPTTAPPLDFCDDFCDDEERTVDLGAAALAELATRRSPDLSAQGGAGGGSAAVHLKCTHLPRWTVREAGGTTPEKLEGTATSGGKLKPLEPLQESNASSRNRAGRSKWSTVEDECLTKLVAQHGVGNWTLIASQLSGRNNKQCRERWVNQLDPALQHGGWNAEDDAKLLRLQAQIGSRWAEISALFEGRSDNSCKNRWNTITNRGTRTDSSRGASAYEGGGGSYEAGGGEEPRTREELRTPRGSPGALGCAFVPIGTPIECAD